MTTYQAGDRVRIVADYSEDNMAPEAVGLTGTVRGVVTNTITIVIVDIDEALLKSGIDETYWCMLSEVEKEDPQ